ncbi:putative translation initiation factor IF3 [Aspergillus mulundensis]|uniref:Translation initiation factor 3 N-terminal domain-containing protein n=1 Tax=Aspergillus mulundensis TaxID=1810919 RepID=A0A3D8RRN6_9EURO|nr:hypothetical protein DSM5745_06610 [Aspergillus mulundensis]RDW76618.1 hypothetical protein DSM5745_06610 [Aspergillus mulundensis]
MKHIRGLVSTTQALRQTFLLPQASPRPQFLRYTPVHPPSQIRFRSAIPRTKQQTTAEVKDEDIPSDYVQIVGEDNKLKEPQRLSTLLRSINRAKVFVIQVQAGTLETPAVCKIMNRQEAYERARALVKAAKAAKKTVKQVELNWAIDAHDLSHRLKKITGFLDKGIQVEIILVRKRHKRPATAEEVKGLMANILEAIKDAGAEQISPMEGEPGKQVVLTVKKKEQ